MNCIYCKFGSSAIVAPIRAVFVPTEEFEEELANLPVKDKAMLMRFSGDGETTLAVNIKEMIQVARKAGFETIAVITNSTLLHDPRVREDLRSSDVLIAKLDACNEETFLKVNRPHQDITFEQVIEGLREMRLEYRGSFRIQVMLVNENQAEVDCIAELCSELRPDAVYLSTPRLSKNSSPLPRKVMMEAYLKFRKKSINVLMERLT